MYRNQKYRNHRLSTVAESLASSSQSSKRSAHNADDTSVGTAAATHLDTAGKENHQIRQPPAAKIHKPNPIESHDDDMFIIPASQITTQSRYVSQRSMLCRTQHRLTGHSATSVSSSSHRPARNYFERVLLRCAVNVDVAECYVLGCDHIAFVGQLRRQLRCDPTFPANAGEFLNGLREEMRTPAQLVKLMSGCKVVIASAGGGGCEPQSKLTQESLIQDFLMLDFVQDELRLLLFDQLKSLAAEDDGASLSLIHLLLAQLMLVDQQKHGEAVFEQIFQILAVASAPVKQMIITSLEDIVDITLHDRVIVKILEIFPNDDDLLTAATVETFGNLCLSAANRRELRRRIVSHMRTGRDGDYRLYPPFVQFLLQLSADESDALPQVVADLRQSLRWPTTTTTTTTATAAAAADVNSSQRSVFDSIVSALIKSRKLFDVWLRVVQTAAASTVPDDEDEVEAVVARDADAENATRSLDLLVMLAMQSINDEKRNYIENIIRRKIKADQLTAQHIEHLVRHYPDVLQQYAKVLLEMLSAFFRDKHASLSRLAGSTYRFLFSIDSWDRKLIVAKLVGFVCHDERGRDADAITTGALLALTAIGAEFPEQMQHNGNQLLRILDHTDDLSLPQVRLFMDLLCAVAYPAVPTDNVPELREHLDMLVRKQVSSTFDKTRNQGIVGMARVIDHMIWQPTVSTADSPVVPDSDATFGCIDDIPDRIAQEAARYVELIRCVTRRCVASLALCYDELASIVSRRHRRNGRLAANAHFIAWLCDLITEDFQEYFVAVELPPAGQSSDIALEYAFCINANEDNTSAGTEVERIAINVAGGVLSASRAGTTNAVSSIACLTALFHLMRSLHAHRHAGDLEPINAVLGCAIIVPSCCVRWLADEDDVGVVDGIGEHAGRVLDMLVHTVNWMRETISAFVSQTNGLIRKKVLQRIGLLVRLERLVRAQLRCSPAAYQMPGGQLTVRQAVVAGAEFKKPLEPTRKTNKKSKKSAQTESAPTQDDTADITVLTALRSVNTSSSAGGSGGERGAEADCRTVYGRREVYRQFDPDVLLLLREDLVMQVQLSADQEGSVMGLVEFEFLLAELVGKVETILGAARPKTGATIDTSSTPAAHWQSVCSASDLHSDVRQFLPRLAAALRQLLDHLAAIVALAVDDPAPKYTPEANYTKACVAHTLRLLAAIFAWPEFGKAELESAFGESMLVLVRAFEPVETDAAAAVSTVPEESAVVRAVRAILAHEAVIMDLAAGVHMVRLVGALSKFDASKNSHQFGVQLCKKILSRRWFAADGTAERGAKCNVLLDELAAGLFVRVKLTSLHQVIVRVLAEVKQLAKKDTVLSMFPMIGKANFPLLYRTMCVALLDTLQRRIAKAASNIVYIKMWEDSCAVINDLLAVVEAINIPRNFVLFLKYAHQFVRQFLLHGLPVLEQCFRTHTQRVREVIRSMQQTTRFLHRLCCHSKCSQNAAIVAQIPLLRETVEALLVRVKALLVANKCCTTDIWEIGVLKNKDLDGQILIQEEDFEDDGDSVIPDRLDEEEDDATLDDDGADGAVTRLRGARSNAEDDGDSTASVRSKNSSRSRVF